MIFGPQAVAPFAVLYPDFFFLKVWEMWNGEFSVSYMFILQKFQGELNYIIVLFFSDLFSGGGELPNLQINC